MNLNSIKTKKSLKIITLLISAVIIATVSAETFRYMYIEGGVTISSAKLVWLAGADVTNCNVTGSSVALAVDVEQGTPMNFTEALFLKNSNVTGSFSYTMSITQELSSSDFERANMYIYTNSTGSWVYVDTIDLTNSADTSTGSLAAGNYLRMTLEFNATASSGTSSFTMQVEYS